MENCFASNVIHFHSLRCHFFIKFSLISIMFYLAKLNSHNKIIRFQQHKVFYVMRIQFHTFAKQAKYLFSKQPKYLFSKQTNVCCLNNGQYMSLAPSCQHSDWLAFRFIKTAFLNFWLMSVVFSLATFLL